MQRRGLLDVEECRLLRRVIGFRTVLVHAYANIGTELVSRIIRAGEYRKLALLAAEILRRAREKGVDP